MTPYRFLLAFASAAASSAIAIAFLYGYAEHLGLVDRPNERKKHVGNIPVIGGVCVFLGVITGAFVAGQFHLFGNYVLVTAAVRGLTDAQPRELQLAHPLVVNDASNPTYQLGRLMHAEGRRWGLW